MAKLRNVLVFVGTLSIVSLVFCLGAYWKYLTNFANEPGPSKQKIEVQIQRGWAAAKVAKLLAEKGVISDERAFYHYLRYVAQSAREIQAGDYVFEAGQTPKQVLTDLKSGRKKEYRLTIPEGANKRDIAQIIESAGFAKSDVLLALMNDPELLRAFGVPGESKYPGVSFGGIEGYLFPDTYQFPVDTPAIEILERMRQRLDEVISEEMLVRMEQMGFDFHSLLTLASIVEKETGDPMERSEIAGVFLNRLKRDMKLQTDPTVIYSINDFSGNLKKVHLKEDHPYNTYVRKGLPPGPIASPGLAAILAVLWPNQTDNLYFVSRNDGTHIFCPTLTCHNEAVQKWQIRYFRQKPKSKIQANGN